MAKIGLTTSDTDFSQRTQTEQQVTLALRACVEEFFMITDEIYEE